MVGITSDLVCFYYIFKLDTVLAEGLNNCVWTSPARLQLGSHPVDKLTVFDVGYGPCDNLFVAFLATIIILLLTILCTGDVAGDRRTDVYEWCEVSAEHQDWLNLEVALHHSHRQTSSQWEAWQCGHTSHRRACTSLKHG